MYNRNMSKVKKAKAKKETSILNRRVSFDYFLGEEIIAGIALTGPEVRAARDRLVQLKGSFVTIRNGEVWLNNASFSLAHNEKGVDNAKTVDTSARKLLLNRKQIEKLQTEKDKGMTILPTKMLVGGRFIKLVIAPGKGKKQYDKRQSIKERDQKRDQKRGGF